MAWIQTLSGKAFDLTTPDARLVDFDNDVAPSLAKLARFLGHTEGDIGYSVAQHCVLGAETIYAKTGSTRLAALFLLHDAHEAYIGDIPTPTVVRLDEMTGGSFSPYLKQLKGSLDWAILRAAGVSPPDEIEYAAIKQHDVAMMNAERVVLKKPAPFSWGLGFDSVPGAAVQAIELQPWDAPCACEEWLHGFNRWIVRKS